MPSISEQWAYALDPTIAKWFEQGFARRPSLIDTLFNVQNSNSATEAVASAGAIGIDAWDLYEQSGVVPEVSFDQGYKKTYTHKEYPVECVIKRKLYDDNKWPQITKIAARMGDSAALKRETDAASVFVNAFTDTAPYAGADAVGLCSAAHPYSPHKTSDTQNNEGTYSLTHDNVSLVRRAMMEFTDDNGNLVACTPNLLLVPPELEDTALEIVGSMNKTGEASNTMNVNAGRFQVLPWHYLSDANAWFLIDSVMMNQSLDWFNRAPLAILPKVEDKTIQSTWIAYMRYSLGWSDWRWIYGNNPS